MDSTTEKVKTRSIGCTISEELYWRFKTAQVARRESTTQAIEIAIRLYLDAIPLERLLEMSRHKEEDENHE